MQSGSAGKMYSCLTEVELAVTAGDKTRFSYVIKVTLSCQKNDAVI